MIAFIACSKTKRKTPGMAKNVYASDLFKKSYAYAIKHADRVYILSAKYGLITPETYIIPYEKTLNKASEKERKRWAYTVFQTFIRWGGQTEEPALFLCGENYRKYLMRLFPNGTAPLKGLSIGNQLKWYKEHT